MKSLFNLIHEKWDVTIPSDYIVYLQESDYNIGSENDPETVDQAMSCK